MELIIALFEAYSKLQKFAHVCDSVSDWVIEKINKWSRNESTARIEVQIEGVAGATAAEIRKAAARVFGDPKCTIPESKREELIGIILNMTRNVRYQRSYGSLDGSFLRSERLLDLLLHGVEPARHQGEPVADGHAWRLQRHLGTGSFGEVWMARNPGYPIPRAFKFFTRDGSGEWLRREQEGLAAILKRLGEHDHIVTFEDIQTEGCKYPYIELEYLGGGSLEEWIVKDEGHRPGLEPHEIIRQVVSGLAAAHAQGIAHRDVKPANILLTEGPDVTVKIGDFGLARVAGSARDGLSQLASLAGLVGTPLFLPPEAQQRGTRRVATQDDVFALGVVWYQLAVGKIERPPYDFAERLLSKGVDSQTVGLIGRCLAHPGRRFQDAREVEDALVDVVPGIVDPPSGALDVQHLARDYLATVTR